MKTFLGGLMLAVSRNLALSEIPPLPKPVKPPAPEVTAITCSVCGETKPTSCFNMKENRRQCQPCRVAIKGLARRARAERVPALRREQLARQNAYGKARHKRMRDELLDAYGGRCACCGEDERQFLAIDHVHNDGAEERAKHKLSATKFLLWLKRQDYPKDRYQLLCHNCNFAKFRYGTCPHTQSRISIVDLALRPQ